MTSATKELLQQAFAHHEAGEIQEAEALYRSVLKPDPENLNGLQLLGRTPGPLQPQRER
jgi:hypothetical protein